MRVVTVICLGFLSFAIARAAFESVECVPIQFSLYALTGFAIGHVYRELSGD